MSVDLQSYLSAKKGLNNYSDILRNIQEYMSNTYDNLLSVDMSDSDEKLVKEYIKQYIVTHSIKLDDFDDDELTNQLFSDMAEFSFLTKFLRNPEKMHLEEIDINSWEDIDLIVNGQRYKSPEHFLSPQHAIDIVRRMLQMSGNVIDDGNPTALGSLAKNIRITVLKTPVLDDDIGIAASIRVVTKTFLSKSTLSQNTATAGMLDFLAMAVKYGISVCIAGNTGSGKTSTASWLMSSLPDSTRIYTIEEGSREFDLIKRGKNGVVLNSVIHTLTKSSLDKSTEITQEDLLDFALRFNPDVICVGEMRSREAFAAQEAARTGHTVITTIHSKTAAGAYMRMTTLAKRAYEFSDDTLMKMMVEAFPIIVFQRQLEDASRKITEIIEGEDYINGVLKYRVLFRYVVDDNSSGSDGKVSVKGHFERGDVISERLRSEFIQNGAPKVIADLF